MKSLILKTMLVISLVTLTSVLALAARPKAKDPCDEELKGGQEARLCSAAEPGLIHNPGVEAAAPCLRGDGKCFKSTSEAELTQVTLRRTKGASGLTDSKDGTEGSTPGRQ